MSVAAGSDDERVAALARGRPSSDGSRHTTTHEAAGGAALRRNGSTPDVTQTYGDEMTHNPYVPDGALDATARDLAAQQAATAHRQGAAAAPMLPLGPPNAAFAAAVATDYVFGDDSPEAARPPPSAGPFGDGPVLHDPAGGDDPFGLHPLQNPFVAQSVDAPAMHSAPSTLRRFSSSAGLGRRASGAGADFGQGADGGGSGTLRREGTQVMRNGPPTAGVQVSGDGAASAAAASRRQSVHVQLASFRGGHAASAAAAGSRKSLLADGPPITVVAANPTEDVEYSPARGSSNGSATAAAAADAAAGRGESADPFGSLRSPLNHNGEASPASSSAAAAAAGGKARDLTTDDRKAAENHKDADALFIPSMKREQFIPVRVARDKVKQVLSEMAQMKAMHLAAIETLEKQHQLLKAQLEAACAAYCRKLCADYNARCAALELEYKKRLAQPGGGGAAAAAAFSAAPPLARAQSTVRPQDAARIRELEQQLGEAGRALDDEQRARRDAEARADANEETVRAFERKVAKLEAAAAAAGGAGDAAALRARVAELEDENHELRQVPAAEEVLALRAENASLHEQLTQLEAEVKELRGY